jgi:hypothetical protein
MAEPQDDVTRLVEHENTFQRRALGAALGLMLAIAPALAFTGFWNWLVLMGVPVMRRGPELGSIVSSAVCLVPVGVFGLAVGFAIAWSEQPRGLVRAFLIVCGLMLVPLVVLLWNQLQAMLIVLAVLALLAATLLLFRQIVEWIQHAFRPSRQPGWGILLVVLVSVVASIGINWVWLQFPLTDEGILLQVHRFALAQGWRGYTLEIGHRVSGVPDVRVRTPDGLVRTCQLMFGPDKQPVQCKP